MEELSDVLESVAGWTQAAADAANAVQKVIEEKSGIYTTDWSKLLAKPCSDFEHKNHEDVIKAFRG